MNRSPEVERFYTSRRWRTCRTAFAKSKGNLCEKCLARGLINAGTKEQPLETHHIIPLDARTVLDPKIALNWDNLQLLCKDCHGAEKERKSKRWRIAADGTVQGPPCSNRK